MKRVLRLLLAAFLVLALGAAALVSLRVTPEPVLTLEPEAKALGRSSPVHVAAQATGRGLAALRLELVQGDQVTALAEKRYPTRAPWAFWGPRTERAELRTDAGSEKVASLKAGEATLRASLRRRR